MRRLSFHVVWEATTSVDVVVSSSKTPPFVAKDPFGVRFRWAFCANCRGSVPSPDICLEAQNALDSTLRSSSLNMMTALTFAAGRICLFRA